MRGGRFKVINSRFVRNRCDPTGPDLGGAAIRVLSQHQGRPVYVVGSTFGGAPGEVVGVSRRSQPKRPGRAAGGSTTSSNPAALTM